MEKVHYRARCHCGRIRFSFKTEKITEGRRCNCSICVRKGNLMSAIYVPEKDFQVHENPDDFVDYRWNDHVVGHLFCKTCGIHPYFGSSEYGYRINLGCVEQLESMSLKVSMIDGKSMAISEDPGPHPGNHHTGNS